MLKLTGSSFTRFVHDEFTTLVRVDNQIFSTSIDLNYMFTLIHIQSSTDEKQLGFIVPVQKGENGSVWGDKVFEHVRMATLDILTNDDRFKLFFCCYHYFIFNILLLHHFFCSRLCSIKSHNVLYPKMCSCRWCLMHCLMNRIVSKGRNMEMEGRYFHCYVDLGVVRLVLWFSLINKLAVLYCSWFVQNL